MSRPGVNLKHFSPPVIGEGFAVDGVTLYTGQFLNLLSGRIFPIKHSPPHIKK